MSMNELIAIRNDVAGLRVTQTVNARELHAFLEVGTRFNDWIASRIEQYGFQGFLDYAVFTENQVKGRPTVEYAITIDMAKELSMVERNEKGKQARQYFLECERRATQVGYVLPQTFAQALRLAAEQQEQIEKQQRVIEHQKPAVQFLENYVEARSTKSLREVAKVLGVKEREFIAMLEDDHILFRQGGNLLPFADYQHRGFFEVKTGESHGHAYHQTRFTTEGIAWIAKRVGVEK